MPDEQPFNKKSINQPESDGIAPVTSSVDELKKSEEQMELTQKQKLLLSIGNRLFVVLVVFLFAMAIWCGYVFYQLLRPDFKGLLDIGSLFPVIFAGIIGGIIGLQQRLSKLPIADLLLLRHSTPYLLLAPLVGGFLSTLLYILFLGGLVEGSLFPAFITAEGSTTENLGMSSVFKVYGKSYQDYGKLIFWCFLAGYSERFVTNIIGQFDDIGSTQSPKQEALEEKHPVQQ